MFIQSRQKRKLPWGLIASAAFTILLLVFLFLNIKLKEIITAVQCVSWKLILIGAFFHLAAYIFRCLALFPFFDKKSISFFELIWVHFIHNFYVHIVPASLGEISFPVLLRKKIPTHKSMAILIVSRMLILMVTVILLLISILFLYSQTLGNFSLQFKNILVIICIVVGFIAVYLLRKKIFNLLNRFSFLSKIIQKIKSVWQQTQNEISKLKSFLFSLKVSVFTLLSIVCTSMFYITILISENIHLNFFEVIFISSIGLVFMIIPIKSVGGFGTTEGSWAIGLMILGIDKQLAIESGFVVHIYALLNVIVIGIVGMIFRFISISSSSKINQIPTQNGT